MRSFAERRAQQFPPFVVTERHKREAEMVAFLVNRPEYSNSTGDLLATVLSCEAFPLDEPGISRLESAHRHKAQCARCQRRYNDALQTKKELMRY